MIGNIGTIPSVKMPAANNAGDAGQRLVRASHELAISEAELGQRTDGHMDIDSVREGAVVICPVKVDGAGIYIGDVHAMQGDGEIAGHTTDVAAEVELKVSIIKDLGLEGPVLLPRLEDLPPLAQPYSQMELSKGAELAQTLGIEAETAVIPIQVVGTGADLTEAIRCGIDRMATLVEMSEDEIRNRVTITGGVKIGRLSGTVAITALLPLRRLDCKGLGNLCRRHYGLKQ
jgi:acetamidase/formamidase